MNAENLNINKSDIKISFPDKVFIVARGGRGEGRRASHEYGETVIKIMQRNNLKVRDLYLHPNGMYTLDGHIADVDKSVSGSDYIWIALVGVDGMKADLQKLCEKYGVKYSGAKSLHSTIIHDKDNLRKIIKQHGVKIPHSYLGTESSDAIKAFSLIGIPAKMVANKTSEIEHFYTVNSFKELEEKFKLLFDSGHEPLVDKSIKGVSVKVFMHKQDEAVHTNIFTESIEDENKIKQNLINIRNEALYIYHILGIEDYIEMDFTVNDKGMYFISADTHPDILSDKYKNMWTKPEFDFEKFVMHRVHNFG
jgi:D-alanine-D-alanine ligase-like ATP-grasp enzyme